jgi:DNA-binding MarR family transcriptional regulator
MTQNDDFDRMRDQWDRERPDLDNSGAEILWRISFIHKALQKDVGRRLARLDMPAWAFDVLASLRRQGLPYQMKPSELCDVVILSSGAMTNRLDRLEEAGLVERLPDADDRRSLIVQLTDDGLDAINRAVEVRFQHANQALAPLSEEEQATLATLLRKLVSARSHA